MEIANLQSSGQESGAIVGFRDFSNHWSWYLPSPETNIAPEIGPSQKETIVFQPSIFRCYVSFREGTHFIYS